MITSATKVFNRPEITVFTFLFLYPFAHYQLSKLLAESITTVIRSIL